MPPSFPLAQTTAASLEHQVSWPAGQWSRSFTAINAAGCYSPQQLPFKFMPTASVVAVNSDTSPVPSPLDPAQSSLIDRHTPRSSVDHASLFPEDQPSPVDSQGMLDNINVASERRQSLEQEELMNLPKSPRPPVPGNLHDAQRAIIHVTQSSTTTSPDFEEHFQTHRSVTSPLRPQLIEPTGRDNAEDDHSAGLQYTSSGLHNVRDSQHQISGMIDTDRPPLPKKRARVRRTRTGYYTCRRRKKKCDEGKPGCVRCHKSRLDCEGYGNKKIVRSPAKSNGWICAGATSSSTASRDYQPHNDQIDARDYRDPPPGSETAIVPVNDGAPYPANKALPQRGRTEDTQHPHTQPQDSSGRSLASGSQCSTAVAREDLISAARAGLAFASTEVTPALLRSASNNGSFSVWDHNARTDERARERNRMLVGRPYLHYCDPQLANERRECRAALERYNNSIRPSVGTSEEECGRLFTSVIRPELRPNSVDDGRPSGRIGRDVMLEGPFTCEYGYNIHLGDEVVVGSGCIMQDAAKIEIGQRCIIGPNVRFYTMTLPTDRRARDGARSLAIAAPITIEADCFIGADVLILPGCRIGHGSVVGAGTIVSKDIPTHCVVAENPPKILRSGPQYAE
ncbi:Acetyltransferase-like protein 3 [Elsinoe fawcettii]|nr:Acetyltransferase-like protein 3 [Elsinoe fawcettii]